MPDPQSMALARKLVKLWHSPRRASDPVFALVVSTRFNALPDDVRELAQLELLSDPEAVENAPARRGRRLDNEVEFERRRQANPLEKRPVVVKVLIAGSGYNGWMTHVDGGGKVLEWNRADDTEDKDETVHHTRDRGKGAEIMFAGPGGSDTKNASRAGGASDSGSNSIAELVAQVPPLIFQAIDAGLVQARAEAHRRQEAAAVAAADGQAAAVVADDGRWPIDVLIKAHSRGAVAASRIANAVKAQYPGARVELAQVDPVPGPQHSGEDLEINVGGEGGVGGLDESTVVYSTASGYSVGFTPQKVHGTKRIIISRQNHSVGLAKGFVYEGELFKGNSLNSLPAGVYADMNADGDNSVPLTRVADIDEAKEAIAEAFKNSSAKTRDYGRLDIITQVLTELFDRA